MIIANLLQDTLSKSYSLLTKEPKLRNHSEFSPKRNMIYEITEHDTYSPRRYGIGRWPTSNRAQHLANIELPKMTFASSKLLLGWLMKGLSKYIKRQQMHVIVVCWKSPAWVTQAYRDWFWRTTNKRGEWDSKPLNQPYHSRVRRLASIWHWQEWDCLITLTSYFHNK